MATLSGQSIQNTYQGLLKLSNSTSGITSSLQSVEDGLGNNTGIKIATNKFYQQNTIPALNVGYTPDYGGPGFAATATAPANVQNKITFGIFYDPGLWAYSAFTYNLNTLSTIGDVYDFAIYDLQWVNNFGLCPQNVIMSGMSFITTGSTGVKTTSLPSTLSFSGYGGGYFALVTKITNSGATPTVRLTNQFVATYNQQYVNLNYGLVLNFAGTQTIGPTKMSTGGQRILTNLSTFNNPYTSADMSGNIQNVSLTDTIGFALNTIR